ncbi:MAG TPA: M15 family metallopeptidase, partial [Acidimicrobiales bacterium]|nr:M15 family metallopeptidase [Acidimicrobiales bacterium]
GAVGTSSASATRGPTIKLEPAPVRAADPSTLLVWTSSPLPGGLGLGARLAQLPGVDQVTTVRAGTVPLVASWDGEGQPVDRPPAGFIIGLDTMAFDPATYPAFLPLSARATFERLGAQQAILGATSARVRRLGVGATLQLGDGRRYTVAAVVDDRLVGATELTVSMASAAVQLPPSYLLVGYHGDRGQLERAITGTIAGIAPLKASVRFRGPGETPFLRQGDAVLAQVFIKERFGEFAYRVGAGTQIVEDPTWAAENIVAADVPILGRIRCHRALIPLLEGALRELERRNLAFLIDRATFEGCWNPVLIASGGDLSRHAWGVAVDLNYGKNPTGAASGQDPRLVQVMESWGFTWGGPWLVPDPTHFEYVQPPQA